MRKLKEKFKKNELAYSLVKRNDVVALYGVGGNYTDKILHYEVCKIHSRSDEFGIREVLPSNEQFGREGSQAILDREQALQYFDKLTASIKSSKGHQINIRRDSAKVFEDCNINLMALLTPDSGN